MVVKRFIFRAPLLRFWPLELSDDFMILVFSPFNIVRFRNDECLGEGAASGESGICYTQEECSSRGGRASGNCAAGFGKCCVCKNSFAKCYLEN